MSRRWRPLLGGLLLFLVGLLCGAWLFADTRPRSLLDLPACRHECWKGRELAGLIGSVVIQRAPGLVPLVEVESARCVGLRHWRPEGSHHWVYFPKRDLRNVMELGEGDWPFVAECLALARQQLELAGIDHYRLLTNGPGLQHLSYLHFHVIAK